MALESREPRSLIVRLFSWIWSLFVFAYRAILVVTVVLFLFAIFGGKRASTPRIEANEPMVLVPTGSIADQVDDRRERSFLRQFSDAKPSQVLLRDLVDALDKAAADARVPFVVLKLDDMDGAGLPQLEEIAVAMRRFRAAGKPIYVYGESFDQRQYYLAAEADEISLDPMGSVMIEGLGVYTNYFKDALDKLGIEINVFRVGEFKSAVEPYERNDMSPEARSANEAWLGDLWKNYGTVVGKARQLDEGAIDRYVAGFSAGLKKHEGDAAAYALEAKLVTRIETQGEFRKRMIEKVGEDKTHGSFRQIDSDSYLAAVQAENLKKPATQKIALVVVQGEIVDGEGDDSSAGGDTVSELLDQARRDEDVSAVVLRVNSPGGSVNASEKIRRAVKALQADGKPVVASMSTLAASGGYWVSMEADQIWAEPTTITGSIGIFGLIPTVSAPLNKLGVHTDGVGTTPLAGAFRIDRPLSAEVKTIMQAQIDKGYQNFIEGVSKGREIPVDQVNSIARGRVWSGEAARGLGLVDELGGLEDARKATAKLAKLEEGAYQLYELQPDRNYFMQLFGRYFGSSRIEAGTLASLIPSGVLGDQAQALAGALGRLNAGPGAYAYCFCEPTLGGHARR